MSGGSLEYLYYRIDDAAERVAEELKAATAPRPPMVVKHDVAAYEVNETRTQRSWWWSAARFTSFEEADKYFSNCAQYEIVERNTLPDGEQQLILRDKCDNTLYDVHSYTHQEYAPDENGEKPYFPDYKPETIAELKNGLTILRVASVYAERMEWLFSGDDGEESFLRRLTEDLEKLKKEGKI